MGGSIYPPAQLTPFSPTVASLIEIVQIAKNRKSSQKQTAVEITNRENSIANIRYHQTVDRSWLIFSSETVTSHAARCDNGQVGQKDAVILCENEAEAASRDSQHLAALG